MKFETPNMNVVMFDNENIATTASSEPSATNAEAAAQAVTGVDNVTTVSYNNITIY